MFEIYMEGRLSPEDDLYFLKKYSEYQNENLSGERFIFEYIHEYLDKLENYLPEDLLSFHLENDFEIMKKIMVWVHKYLIPSGDVIPVRPFNCLNILERTLNDKIKSNCWMYAVVLNEILLSVGYKSKMVRCMPFDLRFIDCHCVVQAYSCEYKKWILLDPAFGTYYTNLNRTPINLKELREFIIKNIKIITPFVPMNKSRKLINYWTKNSFRFESNAISKFNSENNENDSVIYSLLPLHYEIRDKTIVYNNHKTKIIHTHDEQSFWEG